MGGGIYAVIYSDNLKIAKFMEFSDEGDKIRIFEGEGDLNIDKKELILMLSECEITNEKPKLLLKYRKDLGSFNRDEWYKKEQEFLNWFNENVKNVVNSNDYIIFINKYILPES